MLILGIFLPYIFNLRVISPKNNLIMNLNTKVTEFKIVVKIDEFWDNLTKIRTNLTDTGTIHLFFSFSIILITCGFFIVLKIYLPKRVINK